MIRNKLKLLGINSKIKKGQTLNSLKLYGAIYQKLFSTCEHSTIISNRNWRYHSQFLVSHLQVKFLKYSYPRQAEELSVDWRAEPFATLFVDEKEKKGTLSRTSDGISVAKSGVHHNEKERKTKSKREREKENEKERKRREERRGVPPRALGHPCR